MKLRRHCRSHLRLIFPRICGYSLILSLFLCSTLVADKQPVPIFHRYTLQFGGSLCATLDIERRQPMVLIDCHGDTLSPGFDYVIDSLGICLSRKQDGCDSLVIVTESNRSISLDPYSLRPYVTSSEAATVGDPVDVPANRIAKTSGKLEITGAKSFYADVSERNNATLTQGLTMSVVGDLGHQIQVRGSFSDRGLRDSRMTTRRFSELDNVYLEVNSPNLRSVFGDFQLRQNHFRLLDLSRSVQGLQINYMVPQNNSELTVSVPQGNYADHEFETSDGDYGPYRLPGSNGELGIAVVENSDVVWLNGEKLQRGRDRDYYLDYLRGELYFTSRRIIDSGNRVRVEYEFQRLEYRKTLLTAANRLSSSDSSRSVTIGYMGFLTAKNDPVDFGLSESDKAVLERAGDNSDSAVVSGARFVGSGQGNYALDTDTSGFAIYNYVGDGQGDYLVIFSEFESGDYSYLGNGWYQFVGRGEGKYLPLRQLPLPEGTNLLAASALMPVIDGVNLSGETVYSMHDQNLYSGKDDGNNGSIAGLFGLNFRSKQGATTGSLKSEIIPEGFPKISRLNAAEDSYLWQSQTESGIGRKRYVGDLQSRIGEMLHTDFTAGYLSDESGTISRRGNFDGRIKAKKSTDGRLQLNLASSDATVGSRTLFDIRPELRTELAPVALVLKGEYDRRRSQSDLSDRADSKREFETSLSRSGISVTGRWQENHQKNASTWTLLDRKRSAILAVNRSVSGANKIDAALNLNRYSIGTRTENYQTGSLSLVWPSLIPAVNLSSNYRLNRRGYSQTNQTFLKVDPGRGDYVLIDSVYIAQTRGDYILVIENVGDVSQSVEAEKYLQVEFEFDEVYESALTRGTSAQYEISYREIGAPEGSFDYDWLVPSQRYFDSVSRISQRRNDYRIRRFDSGIGLRSEVSLTERRDENDLELIAPVRRNSDEIRIGLNKSLAGADYARLGLSRVKREIKEFGRTNINLREQRIELSLYKFTGPWEFNFISMLSKERADSLNLSTRSLRISPGVNCKLAKLGRVELSTFVLSVTEWAGRAIFIQMADGFPVGTHGGARLRVDIGLSDSFSFKVTGQSEFRQHDENRYYLRSELVSSFK